MAASPFAPTASDDVKRTVVASFPPAHHAEVFYALDTCQLGPVGDGVRLDIILLANGDIERFRCLVARPDHRELYLAAQEKRTGKAVGRKLS